MSVNIKNRTVHFKGMRDHSCKTFIHPYLLLGGRMRYFSTGEQLGKNHGEMDTLFRLVFQTGVLCRMDIVQCPLCTSSAFVKCAPWPGAHSVSAKGSSWAPSSRSVWIAPRPEHNWIRFDLFWARAQKERNVKKMLRERSVSRIHISITIPTNNYTLSLVKNPEIQVFWEMGFGKK